MNRLLEVVRLRGRGASPHAPTRAGAGWAAAAAAAAAALLAALLAPPATGAAVAQEQPGADEGWLFNLEHVYNFNPEQDDPGRSPRVGTDLEFFTHTVPLRNYETGAFVDENGEPLPATDENGDPVPPVMAERDFAVVGSFQRGAYVFDITDPEVPQLVRRVTCRQDRNDVGIAKLTDEAGRTRVVLALTQQSGNPCPDAGGIGLRVDTPVELAGFHEGRQWAGTADVDEQSGQLVYAGTGCTPAHYAEVDAAGKIALVDDSQGAEEADTCGPYTFFQKVRAAQAAGAVGFVQIEREGADRTSNPTALAADIPAVELERAPQVLAWRDAVIGGTSVQATLAADPGSVPLRGSGSGGIGVFDITDPYDWRPLYRLRTGFGGVHNFAFHPTQPYGYVSNGALPGLVNRIPIVDFTVLSNPRVLPGPETEGGVHDVEFSPDGLRAYAASESNYRIYDTSDGAAPVLVSRTPNVGSYAHGVFPSSDRALMVTNNESLVLGGFLVDGTGVCPGEGLASYRIEGPLEQTPLGPLGYYVPDAVGPVSPGEDPENDPGAFCTSHFGRFAPNTHVMSIGWYVAGTRIVDWSSPAQPVEVAGAVMPGANTWAAKFYKGPYVYAGDMGRGFDVFRWSGEGTAPWLPGGESPPDAQLPVPDPGIPPPDAPEPGLPESPEPPHAGLPEAPEPALPVPALPTHP